MKRQIKFRVWNPDDKKMETPLVLAIVNDGTLNFKPLINCSDGNKAYKDYPLMQFTGLQDKNGNDIFEGDILNFLDGKNTSSECGFDWVEDYSIGEVYWCIERNGWQVNNQVMTDDDSVWDDIEIIGNIYETPELLKTTENE